MEYRISGVDPKTQPNAYKNGDMWYLQWSVEKENETLRFARFFKRKINASIYLARLKDDQIPWHTQMRFCWERKSKKPVGS